jgi:hypothetical protein
VHTSYKGALGVVAPLVFSLAGSALLLLIPFVPATAALTPSCADGTGYGGAITTLANPGLTQGGHGCVVIVHSGGTEVFAYTGAVQ